VSQGIFRAESNLLLSNCQNWWRYLKPQSNRCKWNICTIRRYWPWTL